MPIGTQQQPLVSNEPAKVTDALLGGVFKTPLGTRQSPAQAVLVFFMNLIAPQYITNDPRNFQNPGMIQAF